MLSYKERILTDSDRNSAPANALISHSSSDLVMACMAVDESLESPYKAAVPF